jgi:hypothetical protein
VWEVTIRTRQRVIIEDRRLGMNIRSIGRIALLVLAAFAVVVSCSYDYWLDFELGDTSVSAYEVQADYYMTNSGGMTMYDASIHIQVTADLQSGGSEQQDAWVPPNGVDLSSFESFSGTAFFTFVSPINGATIEIIGSRWDDSSDSD